MSGLEAYFAAYDLHADSACTPYLFHKVYEWKGTRYKYAGKTKKGIDCSGFVSELYRQAYCIELHGGSKDLWPLVHPVEREELREGDILFFKIRKGQISHVGVYLGNNKFAHASVHSGVIISGLEEDYYKKYFFKGGRMELSAP
ncbi:MAG: NlpC/P60 family protein [Bacteroidota bacterium]|nr:NlpC/P60 family protein [Bacteroidota bacterium]